MKVTKINTQIQSVLLQLLAQYPRVTNIITVIARNNGRILLVGGAVRDLLLGVIIKDLDIEVHGIALEELQAILKQFGPIRLMGKIFGVLRIDGLDIDWSIPRVDAGGRKPDVQLDPHMGIKQACARRDLTINAMAIDLVTYDLLDPFNGKQDLKSKLLRAPNILFFKEDPLRLFRVMQFIGRFQMQPDSQLENVCKHMDVLAVSIERIAGEFEKLLLKSKRPSLGIRWLKKINRLQDILPELARTVGIEQGLKWHPEGDVFEHSMQALDAAAQQQYKDIKTKLIVLLAALCHDLGKVTTTKKENGKITSYGHAEKGEAVTKKMLARMVLTKETVVSVAKLVRYHMMPVQLVGQQSKPSAYKRLANKLAPHVNLQMLADVARADKLGRNGVSSEPLQEDTPEVEQFLQKAEQAQVKLHKEEPVLLGRDIMDLVEPGVQMGKLLKQVYEAQIEQGIRNKEELRQIAKKLLL